MEKKQTEDVPSSQQNSITYFAFEDFLHVYRKCHDNSEQTRVSRCQAEKESDEIILNPDCPDSKSLILDLTIFFSKDSKLPCFYKPIKAICTYISTSLKEVLNNSELSANDIPTEQISQGLRALCFLTTAVRASPYPLFCQRHKGELLRNFKWSNSLFHDLILYLIPKTDSTLFFDKMLMATLEVMINPPEDYGESNLWRDITEMVESEFSLEEPQVCRFLSYIFVFLSPPARTRIYGSIVDYLKSILDSDVPASLISEIFSLFCFMSLNRKTQQALIREDIHEFLLDWLIHSLDSPSEDNIKENKTKIIQTFANLFQSFEKKNLDILIDDIYRRALQVDQDKQIEVLTDIFSEMLYSVPFSSLVPVCIHFRDLVGKNELQGEIQNQSELSPQFKQKDKILNPQETQNLLKLIKTRYEELMTIRAFDIEWKGMNYKDEKFPDQIGSAELLLIVFPYFINNSITRLGVYIESTVVAKEDFVLKFGSPNNLMFFCTEDNSLEFLTNNLEIKITFPKLKDQISFYEWSKSSKEASFLIEVFHQHKCLIRFVSGSELNINHALLKSYNSKYSIADFFSVNYHNKLQNEVSILEGIPSLNLQEVLKSSGIYGSSKIANDFRRGLEDLRPGKQVFYVPKEMTLREFLDTLFRNVKGITSTLDVYYKQKPIDLDKQIIDSEPGFDNQSLVHIVDLCVCSCFHFVISQSEWKLSPLEMYESIMTRHSIKIRRPLANHLLTSNKPFDFLRTLTVGNSLENPFNLVGGFKIIAESIGTFIDLLSSVMGTDIYLLIWQVIFAKQSVGEHVIRYLYLTILKRISHCNLLASDPKHLFNFLVSALDVVFRDRQLKSEEQELLSQLNFLLEALLDAELIQDAQFLQRFVELAFQRGLLFELNNRLMWDDLLNSQEDHKRIEELFEKGSNILVPYFTNKHFSGNYAKLSESTMTFMKVKGYISAITHQKVFREQLTSLIRLLENEVESKQGPYEITKEMEDTILNLMQNVYQPLAQVLQYKTDLSSEAVLISVISHSLGMFTLLNEELGLCEKEKERELSSLPKFKLIFESVIKILKKGGQIQLMFAQGIDAAQQFCSQYLSKIEEQSTLSILTSVMEKLQCLRDVHLTLQLETIIFDLLEEWSDHDILHQIFEEEIKGYDKEKPVQNFYEVFADNAQRVKSLLEKKKKEKADNETIDDEEEEESIKENVAKILELSRKIQNNLNLKGKFKKYIKI